MTVPCFPVIQTVHENAWPHVTPRPGPWGDCQLAITEGGEELGFGTGGEDVGKESPRI